MTTYATLVTSLTQELHEPNDDSVIDRHVVSALRHLRPYRFLFSDKTVEIDLVADEAALTLGADLPGDIMSIDAVWQIQDNDLQDELKECSIQSYRRLNISSTVTGYPRYWCFYAGRLLLYPTPAGSLSLRIDYQVDPTLDEATGAEITVSAAGTETNEFFRRGEELVRARATYTYSLQRSGDSNAATRAKILFDDAFKSLMRERDAMTMEGQRIQRYGL